MSASSNDVVRLVAEDVVVQQSSKAPWSAQDDGTATVAVDTTIDEELRDSARYAGLKLTASF